MSELISGKEALIALANGEDVLWKANSESIADAKRFIEHPPYLALALDPNCNYQFWIKPRTILINGIEVPAPFEPKDGEDCRCYYISTTFKHGFDWYHSTYHEPNKIAWRTEDEIEQVVSVLRSVLKGRL